MRAHLRSALPRAPALVALVLAAGPAIARQDADHPRGRLRRVQPVPLRFAVIGDYGTVRASTRDVADMVKAWEPDLILTTGDNNYPDGEQATIDQNIGQFYHEFIHPYVGSYGPGASTNRFFPSLGNHDWNTPGAAPYLAYFELPGNERYYELRRGPVHFFVVDSDPDEPHGNKSSSAQAQWLESRLAASNALYRFVFCHAPPYSSGPHGSIAVMQWPFREWGASAVFSGHDHIYERISVDGFPYIVCGASGANLYPIGPRVAGSQVAFNADFGALLVSATELHATVRFVTRAGVVVDTFTIPSDPRYPASLDAVPPGG